MTSPAPTDDLPPLVALADVPAGISQDALDAASAAVRDYCGWHIAPSIGTTFARRPDGLRVVLLPSLYVTAVGSVTCDGAAVDASEWDEDLIESGMLKRLRGVWHGRVAVTFTHGYVSCPPAVVGVVAAIASSGVVGQGGQQAAGPFSMTPTSWAQAGAIGLGAAHRSALDRYRLPSIP